MKVLLPIFFISFLLNIQQVFAHGDHNHVAMTESQAIELTGEVATQLSIKDAGLGFGKLSESWKTVPVENIKIHKKGNGYYITSMTNNNEKKTMYVLMSLGGDVYDANFTGKFQGVE